MTHSHVRVINFTGVSGGTFPQAQDLTVSTSPPGLTPKGAVFFTTSTASLSNSTSSPSRLSVGFCDELLVQRCVAVMAQDNTAAANANTAHRIDTSTVVQITGVNGGGLSAEADVTDFVEDGVNVSWSAGSNAHGQAVLFFGTDCRTATRTLTGSSSVDGTASVTGLDFAPDFVIVASVNDTFAADKNAGEAMMSIGWAARTSDTQSCGAVVWEDEQSPTSVGTIARDDCAAVQITSTAGAVAESARLEVTSWNSDGITFTTRNAASSLVIGMLLVKMPNTSAWAGCPALPTSSTGSFSRTDPQFKPQALLFNSVLLGVTNTVVSTRGQMAVGATTAFETGCTTVMDRDNQATSESGCVWITIRSVNLYQTRATADWQGTVTSFDAVGWTATVSNASSEDRPVPYFAISISNIIVADETEQISEGFVSQQNPLRALDETEEISETFVGVTAGPGGMFQTLVCDETVQIEGDVFLVKGEIIADEEEEIRESLIFVGDALFVLNETEELSETFFRYPGEAHTFDETVEITEETNNGAGPVPLKRTWRGTTLYGGSVSGSTLMAGTERGNTRG